MTTPTVLAWESGNWAWNQFGHGMGSNGEAAVLSAQRSTTILESIRDSARTLGDDHLDDMIRTYLQNELISVTREIG